MFGHREHLELLLSEQLSKSCLVMQGMFICGFSVGILHWLCVHPQITSQCQCGIGGGRYM